MAKKAVKKTTSKKKTPAKKTTKKVATKKATTKAASKKVTTVKPKASPALHSESKAEVINDRILSMHFKLGVLTGLVGRIAKHLGLRIDEGLIVNQDIAHAQQNMLPDAATSLPVSAMGSDTKPANGAAKFTQEDVTQALQKVGTEHGLPKVKEILNSVGAESVSGINNSKYDEVIIACKAVGEIAANQAATQPATPPPSNASTGATSMF